MNRMSILNVLPQVFRAALAAFAMGACVQAHAVISGTTGEVSVAGSVTTRTFTLTARHDFISTSDGFSQYTWGYAQPDFPMQYPGPTLIVNQGDTVKIVLSNALPVPVSIVFPGQQGVSATTDNSVAGVLTREARAVTPAELAANTAVMGPTYTFVAGNPGTYLYHSGTNPDLQVEMGLVGALIVRPAGYVPTTKASWKAYQQAGTNYDRENLFLLSEMDSNFHLAVYNQVFSGLPVTVDTTTIHPSLWFINGRNAPDTLLEDHVGWLPTQPYNALPRMHPGERLLMRVVNAGRDLHPFHHHGNHATPIARDARVLSSNPSDLSLAPDLSSPDFTVRSIPGQTMDLIFEWTGKGIGWDIYGHAPGDPLEPNEWAADHGKPIPVTVAGQLDLSYGENYGGSPFLGGLGSLPQGHPGLNATGGYFHMWHSHNEKEVTTDDIFPGGMMTMLIIEPASVNLDVAAEEGGGPAGVPSAVFSSGSGTGSLNGAGTALAFGARNGTVSNVLTLTVNGTADAIFGAATVTNGVNSANRFSIGDIDTCSGTTRHVGETCQIRINFNANQNAARVGTLTVPFNGSGSAVLSLSGS